MSEQRERVELSVVLPTHNEQETVREVVQEVLGVLEERGVPYEIVLVNDGSTDRTGRIARDLERDIPVLRLVENWPGRGYGGALKAGFEAARGEWIAFFPTDGQFAFVEVDRLISLSGQADIVCGYRAKRQDNVLRRFNAWGWNWVVRLLFGCLCRDIDCGFKLLRREILARIQLVSDGAMIDTELLAGARARRYRIAEAPVTHRPRLAGEATGANPLVVVRAFRDLVRFRVRLSREMRLEGRG